MKKILVIISIFAIFIFIYFLQSNFFSWFNIAGVKPNLFIVFILLIGLFMGETLGTSLGIIFGISIDFFIGKNIGITGVMLGLIGFLGGYFDKNFSKDSRITIMLMTIGITIIYEIGIYVFNNLASTYGLIDILNFIKILFIETVYNTILVIILYPLLLKMGYFAENNVKRQKILTRYF